MHQQVIILFYDWEKREKEHSGNLTREREKKKPVPCFLLLTFFPFPKKKVFLVQSFYVYIYNIFIRYYYYYSPKTQELCEKCKKNIRKISFNKASVFFFFLCSFWRREFFLNWRCANKLKPMMLDSRKPVFPLLKTTLLCDSSIHVLQYRTQQKQVTCSSSSLYNSRYSTHTHTHKVICCVCV